ncbi:MAG TPA: FtsX-like permease family protein [Gemmatimonadaceae bacterium]|nr:FtsX-like permease family protein [Gemmatimonadaceae bacterium]
MMLRLALHSLTRRRSRTALTVAGVAVAAAMLLDMVMLGSGMRESFRGFVEQQGFDLRLTPRGTMPFDTEATVGGGAALVARLRADPQIAEVAPVLGGRVFVSEPDPVAAFSIGLEPAVQADYVLEDGRDIAAGDEMVANAALLAAVGAEIGDTVRVAGGYDPQMRRVTGARQLALVGRGRFVMLAADERAVAMPLATLQSMVEPARAGAATSEPVRADRLSVILIRARDGVDIEALRTRLEREDPRLSALSTAAALEFMDERLGYFRQLAFILASVSLLVGFLLVTTLVTVSVNERIGEIAVMRAIGVARGRIVAQVMAEGLALSAVGATLGLGLGLLTARWLNGILAAFPGLPDAFDFFLFEPSSAVRSLAMLVACGVLAGIWPAWRAATLPIARTLREEAVA